MPPNKRGPRLPRAPRAGQTRAGGLKRVGENSVKKALRGGKTTPHGAAPAKSANPDKFAISGEVSSPPPPRIDHAIEDVDSGWVRVQESKRHREVRARKALAAFGAGKVSAGDTGEAKKPPEGGRNNLVDSAVEADSVDERSAAANHASGRGRKAAAKTTKTGPPSPPIPKPHADAQAHHPAPDDPEEAPTDIDAEEASTDLEHEWSDTAPTVKDGGTPIT